MPAGSDLDVGRLEIAVNDAALVRGLERRRDLLREAQRVRQAEAARYTLGYGVAFDELQDETADAGLSSMP